MSDECVLGLSLCVVLRCTSSCALLRRSASRRSACRRSTTASPGGADSPHNRLAFAPNSSISDCFTYPVPCVVVPRATCAIRCWCCVRVDVETHRSPFGFPFSPARSKQGDRERLVLQYLEKARRDGTLRPRARTRSRLLPARRRTLDPPPPSADPRASRAPQSSFLAPHTARPRTTTTTTQVGASMGKFEDKMWALLREAVLDADMARCVDTRCVDTALQ